MNKKIIYAIAIVVTMMAGSCSKGKDARPLIEFQEYDFSAIGIIERDMLPYEGYDSLIDVEGYGVMPVKIGDNDLSELRDSLGVLGRFQVNEQIEAEPRPMENVTYRTKTEADSVAGSTSIARLTISMLSPELIVWRGYAADYIVGMAHGYYQTLYLNYSIEENKVLSMGDIFKMEMSEELLGKIRDRLRDMPEVFTPETAEMPEEFSLTPTGVKFIYGIYDIAPYSAGEIEVDFDAYELEEFLTPKGKHYLDL